MFPQQLPSFSFFARSLSCLPSLHLRPFPHFLGEDQQGSQEPHNREPAIPGQCLRPQTAALIKWHHPRHLCLQPPPSRRVSQAQTVTPGDDFYFSPELSPFPTEAGGRNVPEQNATSLKHLGFCFPKSWAHQVGQNLRKWQRGPREAG